MPSAPFISSQFQQTRVWWTLQLPQASLKWDIYLLICIPDLRFLKYMFLNPRCSQLWRAKWKRSLATVVAELELHKGTHSQVPMRPIVPSTVTIAVPQWHRRSHHSVRFSILPIALEGASIRPPLPTLQTAPLHSSAFYSTWGKIYNAFRMNAAEATKTHIIPLKEKHAILVPWWSLARQCVLSRTGQPGHIKECYQVLQ